ncbi:TPA: FAD-dependent thymidylate synthase [Candidatus Bipolaricaulota bacterium]|nr:FAD-dependent thymidylate synthase [Candidatus Bipolaricaulota bacterium]
MIQHQHQQKQRRRIYLLSERELSPEVIAVTFAKTSRSPRSFDEIVSELSEEESSRFHERWVLGFGHGSIAEHAVLHIAIENVSRLAAEVIENNRLCSYTERSSRYQEFTDYYIPAGLDSDLHRLYIETCDRLFATYRHCLAKLSSHDVCRFLLPAAALANLGMTANARSLEWAITKLLSHPLSEVCEIGKEMKEVALKEVPTLIRHAEPNRYLINKEEAIRAWSRSQGYSPGESQSPGPGLHKCKCESVLLVSYDKEAEERFIAASLYRHPNSNLRLTFPQLLEWARHLPSEEKGKLIRTILSPLEPHDRPPRELEQVYYTFDCLVDQGAYRDLARHRMLTLIAQPLTVKYGYAIPRGIVEAGFLEDYREAIDLATSAYRKVAERHPYEAAYLVTNAHNRRFLMTLNLRELYHLVALRSRKEGHFSYRRIALKIFELAREKHPLLLEHLPFREPPESSALLEEEYFAELAHPA